MTCSKIAHSVGVIVAVASLVAGCASSSSSPSTSSDDLVAKGLPAPTAKTVLRIPLLAEDPKKDEVVGLMSAYNDQLKAKKVGPIPDFVDVDGPEAAQKYSDFRQAFSEAAYDLKLPVQDYTRGTNPGAYESQHGTPAICYIGDASKVADLVSASVDSVFSDQLGIFAWRYKKEVHEVEADLENDFGADGLELPTEWKTWKGDTESIMFMTHEGDGGDDVAVGVIAKCP